MAKFNTKKIGTKTTNLAGGNAYSLTPEFELASILLTSFGENQYYRTDDETFSRLDELIPKVGENFARKAAIYARKEFGMRSITHAYAGIIGHTIKGAEWTKDFFDEIVYRPDDITEILSFTLENYGKPIPNAMKKGLGKALSRFNEYALGKYAEKKKDISLVDAVNLLHPPHTEAIKKLIKGTLSPPKTWEVLLTQAGQNTKDEEEKKRRKAAVWETLLTEKQLGYFALLRNLRNIAIQAPYMLDEALTQLIDKTAIKNSLIFPFRFSTAIAQFQKKNYDYAVNIQNIPQELCTKIVRALNKAMEFSLDNIPEFNGETLIVIDTSGSMKGKPIEIASLFGAALFKKMGADIMVFSNSAHYIRGMNPDDTLASIKQNIKREVAFAGTNFHSIFKTANRTYDRIIILSDMQGWMDDLAWDTWESPGAPKKSFSDYCEKYKTRPYLYSFDLQGYGTAQFPENKVFCIAGFSDKIFDIMKLLEQDPKALVNTIEGYNTSRKG